MLSAVTHTQHSTKERRFTAAVVYVVQTLFTYRVVQNLQPHSHYSCYKYYIIIIIIIIVS
jgi:hypothetical protein